MSYIKLLTILYNIVFKYTIAYPKLYTALLAEAGFAGFASSASRLPPPQNRRV